MTFGNSSPDDLNPLSEINVTPLIDVMLVLLVVFMVAAPMLESGIALQLPKASAKALPQQDDPTILSLTKDYRIYLNKMELSLSELSGEMQRLGQGNAQCEVFIRADGELPYAFVAKVVAMVKGAGISRLGLVMSPEEAKPKAKSKR